MSSAYRKAGVDIDAGDALVRAIAPLAAGTRRPGATAAIGGFGGLFDPKAAGFEDPILVSGTDGVGTKLKIAIETNNHDTIGEDLVAMCANDILAQGATPLFFLDYFACGTLDKETARRVIAGIARGCKKAGAALIGGETAEMPGMYEDGVYDLAGFCVGAVERDALLPKQDGPEQISAGDVMIALPASGAHSNGYSLIRKIIDDAGVSWEMPAPFAPEKSLCDVLLEPTRFYTRPVLHLLKRGLVKGFAHITGGGLTDNVPRVLPDTLCPSYDETTLTMPALFSWLQTCGDISDKDMRRTFNCGIGGVVITASKTATTALRELTNINEHAFVIGTIQPRT